MIDERELQDMQRWHWREGGLNNQDEAIDRLLKSYSDALRVVRAAQFLQGSLIPIAAALYPDNAWRIIKKPAFIDGCIRLDETLPALLQVRK